jgi:hypothetical protein
MELGLGEVLARALSLRYVSSRCFCIYFERGDIDDTWSG